MLSANQSEAISIANKVVKSDVAGLLKKQRTKKRARIHSFNIKNKFLIFYIRNGKIGLL